jgi:hypothetical protein
MLEIQRVRIHSLGKRNKNYLTMQKKHALEEHGITAAEFEDVKKNEEKYRSLIKKT